MIELNHVEKWVLRERVGGRSHAELALGCGLSVDRVRQVARAAIRKLADAEGLVVNGEELDGNCRLDAEAPAFYDACKRLLSAIEGYGHAFNDMFGDDEDFGRALDDIERSIKRADGIPCDDEEGE